MKKVFVFMVAVIFAFTLASCGSSKKDVPTTINFDNQSSYSILYGLSISDAKWDKALNAYSDTYATWGEGGTSVTAGDFYVQMKDSTGVWSNATSGKLTVVAEHDQDLELKGTSLATLTCSIYDWGSNANVADDAGGESEASLNRKAKSPVRVDTVEFTQ